jgi:AraC-like DNA-binding protein
MTAGENGGGRPLAHMSTVLETDTRKFGFFCEAICGVYCGIQPERSTDRPFDADFSAHALAGCIAATIAAPGHIARRDRAMIDRSPDDGLFLNFSAISSFRARHAGREWRVRPATPFLLDNRQPFDLDFDANRRMRLHTLRITDNAGLGAITPERIRRANQAIDTMATGRQLALQVGLLAEAIDAGNIALADLMSRPAIGLLRLLLEDGEPAAKGSLADIKTAALSHIADPDFGIDALAAIFRCSARTLQSRFARNDESFGAWLLEERLQRARTRLLASDSAGRSIEAVARGCGFRDPSHFHRAFRRRFGVTPGAIRR